MKPSDEDKEFWHAQQRQARTKVYHKKTTVAPKPKPSSQRPVSKITPLPQASGRELDANTLAKLRRGEMALEGTLDLHGQTRDSAAAIFRRYITKAYGLGKRCVLVITGQGKQGGGVLKSALPEWLQDEAMVALVLRAVPAQPKHGGHGAWYVYLRRQRLKE